MLSLDANVVVVFAIVWILVFILTKLFFNPVRRVRDRRESGLAADRKARQQALEGYEKSLAEIESALKDAKAAAEAARARLEQDALKERNQLLAEGLTTFVSQNWVFVCPPLCITQDELLVGLKIIENALPIADSKANA